MTDVELATQLNDLQLLGRYATRIETPLGYVVRDEKDITKWRAFKTRYFFDEPLGIFDFPETAFRRIYNAWPDAPQWEAQASTERETENSGGK